MENLRRKENDRNTMTAEAGGLAVGSRPWHEVRVVGHWCTLCWPGEVHVSGRLILSSVSSHRLEESW